MTLRRTAVALVSATLFLSACGSDTPTREEFISEVKDSMGSDTTQTLEGSGLSTEAAETVVDEYVGCIYDSIKDDEDLLAKAYDDDADVEAELTEKSAGCNEDLIAAVTEAITADVEG